MSEEFESQDRKVEQILSFISSQSEISMTAQAISAKLGMSMSTMQRALRTARLSCRTVLSVKRLAVAERLLREDPKEKVEVLSLSAGWKSRKSLYTAVLRFRGCRLEQWREQVRDGSVSPLRWIDVVETVRRNGADR
jgi:AraC-like DNA-binding protein